MTVHGRLPVGTTRVAAVVGSPIRHSLSPTLLNTAFAANGDDWVFCAFDVGLDELPGVMAAARALPFAGLSVTMPLKAAIIDHLDEVDATARRLDSVNCVAWDDGRLVGYSTDGVGLVDALRDELAFDPYGRRCGVVGAGGAARAAIAALSDAGATEVLVVNRTRERAEAAVTLAGDRGHVATSDALEDVDLIVNATPAGMAGVDVPSTPFDLRLIGPDQVVYDMVYEPRRTVLVEAALGVGARAAGGLSMLVHQAAHAYGHWLTREAPVDAMSAAVREVEGTDDEGSTT